MEIQLSTDKFEEMACNFPASRGRYSILVPRVFSINPEIEEQNIHGHLKFLWTVLFKLMTFVLYQTASFFHLTCNVRSLTSDTLEKKRMEQQISGAYQMRSCIFLYSYHPLVILVKWESCDHFLS